MLLSAALICFCLCCCNTATKPAQIVATTLPVYEFTKTLCSGTDIAVERLINEDISCLHNYTLQTKQMRAVENAQVIVISGSGLEDFLTGIELTHQKVINASENIALTYTQSEHEENHGHHHDQDPHIWLSPVLAKQMADNIYQQLCQIFPQYAGEFIENLTRLNESFNKLQEHAEGTLETLSCREIMTFHDGFSYMAESFDLRVVHAVEEESGSEASAAELIEMIGIVKEHGLTALFTERNGSDAAATIIAAETNARIYQLDMAISGDSYFDAMYQNIDTLKEALG